MALFKKKFIYFGEPYDTILYDYMNGNKYPSSKEEWSILNDISTELKGTFYRGTDYSPIIEAKEGELLDFSQRYYSYTEKKKIASQIAGEDGVVLIVEGPIYGIDLRNINTLQKEVLISPNIFILDKKLEKEYYLSVKKIIDSNTEPTEVEIFS